MVDEIERSKERVKLTAEVFTPMELVYQMLDDIPADTWKDPTKNYLDPTSGDGNFVEGVVHRKLEHGLTMVEALKSTWAVDLMEDNIKYCKHRLLKIVEEKDPAALEECKEIIEHNIVCNDFFTWDFENWKELKVNTLEEWF